MLSHDIERVFYEVFFEQYHTVLIGGYSEPLYLYSSTLSESHRICYRHDFTASALHEVAHWCIAGPQRRKLNDYGYWYHPDGRDAFSQKSFYRVEALPQALEKYFHECIKSQGFHLSLDNLEGSTSKEEAKGFELLVAGHFDEIQRGMMPQRAKLFSERLKYWVGGR